MKEDLKSQFKCIIINKKLLLVFKFYLGEMAFLFLIQIITLIILCILKYLLNIKGPFQGNEQPRGTCKLGLMS